MALNVVLVEPEIPPNTGNVARTCAATGSVLHLVRPLGFDVDDKTIKRAGLDYWDKVKVVVHGSWQEFLAFMGDARAWYFTTKAGQSHVQVAFLDGDFLIFGKETRGLDEEILRKNREQCVRLPMKQDIRSLNLSNTVAIVVYEALRQQGFPGFQHEGHLEN